MSGNPLSCSARSRRARSKRDIHAQALGAVLNQHSSGSQMHLFNHLYGSLNILDTKTQTLVQFNALLFAICSLLISPDIGESALVGKLTDPALISILASTILAF